MFPENAHQPALDVASRLLASVGAGWASRVFFSDDGCASFARRPAYLNTGLIKLDVVRSIIAAW